MGDYPGKGEPEKMIGESERAEKDREIEEIFYNKLGAAELKTGEAIEPPDYTNNVSTKSYLEVRIDRLEALVKRIENLEDYAKKSTAAHESLLEALTAIHDQLANLADLAREHDQRIDSLETLVKRIAAHLGVEG